LLFADLLKSGLRRRFMDRRRPERAAQARDLHSGHSNNA